MLGRHQTSRRSSIAMALPLYVMSSSTDTDSDTLTLTTVQRRCLCQQAFATVISPDSFELSFSSSPSVDPAIQFLQVNQQLRYCLHRSDWIVIIFWTLPGSLCPLFLPRLGFSSGLGTLVYFFYLSFVSIRLWVGWDSHITSSVLRYFCNHG